MPNDFANFPELHALMERARELLHGAELNIHELRKTSEQVRNLAPQAHEREQFEQVRLRVAEQMEAGVEKRE